MAIKNNCRKEDIERIVSKAFSSLPIPLAEACISKGYFVTLLEDMDCGGSYILIDTTRKMTFNVDDFINSMEGAFDSLLSVERWYDC